MATKTVWMYWHQGWDDAPPIVQACRNSWERLNPGYEVRALDRHSMFEHVDLPAGVGPDRDDLTLTKLSNVIRLRLLARHGGVWADATVLCAWPLDDWLPHRLGEGFFAFKEPGPGRMLST